jgi:hypothetical protein
MGRAVMQMTIGYRLAANRARRMGRSCMHTGLPVKPHLKHSIMTFASHFDGVCAELTKTPSAPRDGSLSLLLSKSSPVPSLMAFWPSAPCLVDARRLGDQGAPLPSPTPALTAAQEVDSLALQALQHQAVQHPYLRALACGELPDLRWALRDFARQYYAYSAHFPRYLTAVISKLERPAHRLALLENLTEESGQYGQDELEELAAIGIAPEWIVGLPHPELFRRFRRAVGVLDDDSRPEAIEVVCWREQFLAILNSGTAAEALGALGLGTETIV